MSFTLIVVFSRVSVRLGEHKLSQQIDCQRYKCAPEPMDISVEGKIAHPEYNNPVVHNDIGLIRLSRSVELGDRGIT